MRSPEHPLDRVVHPADVLYLYYTLYMARRQCKGIGWEGCVMWGLTYLLVCLLHVQLGTVKLSRWRHWLNFIKTNGAAPRAAKSALQRSRLCIVYWQLHQLWKSFELHERSKLHELARAVMIGRVLIAVFYHFLISVFSLFHWEPWTLTQLSRYAYSQHQHQATSWWHDNAPVRCSHAQQ